MTCGRSRRMISTRRPIASSRSALGEAARIGVLGRVGHARVAVAEHDELVVPDRRHRGGQLLHDGPRASRSRISGRSIAGFRMSPASPPVQHTSTARAPSCDVPGDGAGTLRRLVVGVGMDAEDAQLIGHRAHGTAATRPPTIGRRRSGDGARDATPRRAGSGWSRGGGACRSVRRRSLTAMWWTGPVASGRASSGASRPEVGRGDVPADAHPRSVTRNGQGVDPTEVQRGHAALQPGGLRSSRCGFTVVSTSSPESSR